MNRDERLRQSFRELREDDARRVPPFSLVARGPNTSPALPWFRLAAAAVLVIALVATAVLVPTLHHKPATDSQQWAALAEWNARTDELLTGPETPWGGPVSSPTDAWLEHSQLTRQ